MAYTSAEGRQQLLDGLADAIEELAFALAALGAAYEQLDDATADKLEEDLFGPAQVAYGRAKRTYAGFADRHGLPARTFPPAEPGLPSTGARGFIDSAMSAAAGAGEALAGVQDSPESLEVGDAELRAGLAEVRGLVDGLAPAARELTRRLGR